MTQPVKLLPCPFCGAAADITEELDSPFNKSKLMAYTVSCSTFFCGATSRKFYDRDKLVTFWNHRVGVTK